MWWMTGVLMLEVLRKLMTLRVEWMRERPLGVAIMSITASHVLSAAICASDSSPVWTLY